MKNHKETKREIETIQQVEQSSDSNGKGKGDLRAIDFEEAAIAIGDYADAGQTYPFTTW